MQRRVRVLHIINGLNIGGAERLLVDCLRFGDRDQFEYLVCSMAPLGLMADELEGLGLPVYSVHMRGLEPMGMLRLGRLIHKLQPDVVHTHLYRSSLVGRITAWLLGVNVIVSTDHGLTERFVEGRPRTFFFSALDGLTATLVDRVIAVSEATKRYLTKFNHVPAHKIEVIYNGVVAERFHSRVVRGNDSAAVVGFVGRLSEQKGVEYLIRAMPVVLRRFPGVRFRIVGDGPLRHSLEALALELGVAPQVDFVGARMDIPAQLSGIDVFVLPSLWEPFGIVLLEAMAMERPVVASSVDGIPEVVLEGTTGYLTPPGDFAALATAVCRLLNDPSLRARLGRQGRQRVLDKFQLEATVNQLEATYLRLVAK